MSLMFVSYRLENYSTEFDESFKDWYYIPTDIKLYRTYYVYIN